MFRWFRFDGFVPLFRWFCWFRSGVSMVSAVPVVSVVSFRWFRFGVSGFSTCREFPSRVTGKHCKNIFITWIKPVYSGSQ